MTYPDTNCRKKVRLQTEEGRAFWGVQRPRTPSSPCRPASDMCIPSLQIAHLVSVVVPRVHSCQALPATPPALPGASLFFLPSLHTHLPSRFLEAATVLSKQKTPALPCLLSVHPWELWVAPVWCWAVYLRPWAVTQAESGPGRGHFDHLFYVSF